MKRGKSDLCFVFFPVCSSSCSGRSDRLAHLPLGSGHPEEDRAGQGVLTAPPAGLQRCNTDQDTDTETESRRTDGWMDGGRSLTEQFGFLQSFCLLSDRMRDKRREDGEVFKSAKVFNSSVSVVIVGRSSGEEPEVHSPLFNLMPTGRSQNQTSDIDERLFL